MNDRVIPLLACLALAACAAGRKPPAPAPSPVSTTVPPPAFLIVDHPSRIRRACVVQNGKVAEVELVYNFMTGDSLYQGVPFAQAFPSGREYAEAAQWYVDNMPIVYQPGPRFIRYGLPRLLKPEQITRIGEYDGVGVYGEAGWTQFHDVIYLPVRPGCWFQPYVPLAKM